MHYRLLTLPSRVLDRPLPQVNLIDLRRERPARGGFSALSPTLEHAIHEALSADGQMMVGQGTCGGAPIIYRMRVPALTTGP